MIANQALREFFPAYVMHNFVRRYFLYLGTIYAGNVAETRKKWANLERYRSWLFFQAMIDYDACNSFSKGAFQRRVKLIVTDEAMQTWAF